MDVLLILYGAITALGVFFFTLAFIGGVGDHDEEHAQYSIKMAIRSPLWPWYLWLLIVSYIRIAIRLART